MLIVHAPFSGPLLSLSVACHPGLACVPRMPKRLGRCMVSLPNEAGMLDAKHIVGPGVSQVRCQVVQGCLVSGLCLQAAHTQLSKPI